jgi:ankyrin repeat protein
MQDGATALMTSIATNNDTAFMLLLDRGADVNATDKVLVTSSQKQIKK